MHKFEAGRRSLCDNNAATCPTDRPESERAIKRVPAHSFLPSQPLVELRRDRFGRLQRLIRGLIILGEHRVRSFSDPGLPSLFLYDRLKYCVRRVADTDLLEQTTAVPAIFSSALRIARLSFPRLD